MRLRRARLELSYDELELICSHHPDDLDPTIVEMNDKEYVGDLKVEKHKNTYIIRLTIKDDNTSRH